MPVDVVTSIEIERSRAEVAAFASDPDYAPRWYRNVESVRLVPVGAGPDRRMSG